MGALWVETKGSLNEGLQVKFLLYHYLAMNEGSCCMSRDVVGEVFAGTLN
jgi:hypothetical protein